MIVKLCIKKLVFCSRNNPVKNKRSLAGITGGLWLVLLLFILNGLLLSDLKAQPISDGPFTGNPVAMTSLANYPIGQNKDWRVSIRFKSDYSGSLARFKLYWKYAPGYSAGDGGDIKITLRTDDGTSSHNPSSTILATTIFYPNIQSGVDVRFKELSFPVAPLIEKDKTYHLHFENLHPDKSNNWISINNVYNHGRSESTLQPTEDPTEWGLLNRLGATGAWKLSPGFCPILALGISRTGVTTPDVYQGNGYMEFWGASSNGVRVGGTSLLRQGFNSTTSMTVGGISVNAGKYTGTGALQVELLSSTGTVLGSGTISADSFPNATSSTNCPGGVTGDKCHVWGYAQFSTAPSVIEGQSYYIRITAPSGSQYRFNFPRDGSIKYGWPAGTVVSGRIEKSTNAGGTWTGITYYGITNRSDADLEFFLEPL